MIMQKGQCCSFHYFPIFFIPVSQKGDGWKAVRRNKLGMLQILIWLWKVNQQESTHYRISYNSCWYIRRGPRTQLYLPLQYHNLLLEEIPVSAERKGKVFSLILLLVALLRAVPIAPHLRSGIPLAGQRFPFPTGVPRESKTSHLPENQQAWVFPSLFGKGAWISVVLILFIIII